MREFYDRNADFKRYVDRYCNQYGLTVEEAMEHELVKQVADCPLTVIVDPAAFVE